jgi:hypothetical protein
MDDPVGDRNHKVLGFFAVFLRMSRSDNELIVKASSENGRPDQNSATLAVGGFFHKRIVTERINRPKGEPSCQWLLVKDSSPKAACSAYKQYEEDSEFYGSE